jgi:hypothetical protein
MQPHILRFAPNTTQPGGQFFHVHVRVEGIPAGRTTVLELAWPEAKERPPEVSPGSEAARASFNTFAAVAPVFRRAADGFWHRHPDVSFVPPNTVRIRLDGTSPALLL